MLEHALPIRERALVPDHVDFAKTLNAIAKVHCGQNRYEDAQPLLLRVLAIRKSLVPDHPSTKEARDTLDILRAAK
jgi:hypothetical protein